MEVHEHEFGAVTFVFLGREGSEAGKGTGLQLDHPIEKVAELIGHLLIAFLVEIEVCPADVAARIVEALTPSGV